jgi:pimeloyl-ACP methyl ester carboxylesterase
MAAILVVVATACTRGSTTAAKLSPIPTSSPVQRAAWSSCGGGFQCATLPVPLDYAHPNGETIKLALIRKPATDSAHRIGSILTNPGGPGAPGIDFLKGIAPALANLNGRFDLVSFDPRGVGQSAPVRCLTGPQEDTFNALDGVLDDPIEKAAGIQADRDFAAGCQSMSGKLLPFIDTQSVARDMDRIRAWLGDSKLTYLGFSYGTYLGEWYAHLFPTHVRALALDGVLDPAISPNDLSLAQVKGLQQNLEAWAADCKAKVSCQFGRNGDPMTKIVNLLQTLDDHPMQVGARQLTRALAIYGIGVTLYDTGGWPYLDQALTAAAGGNGGLLLAFADAYLGRQSNGTYDNETDSNVAINCIDHPVPTDIASYDALGAAFASASPVFGPSFQYGNLVCAYWPVPAKGQSGALTIDGAPPILLVGGSNDPITPYSWAQSANQEIAGSVLLTRRGYGHTSYEASACAQAAEDAYLIDLTLPPVGTVCSS